MRILVTSIGSFGFGPSLVKMLRLSIPDAVLFGMDVSGESAAMHLVDRAVVAPPYGDGEIRMIYEVCRAERIEVLLALNGDRELLPLLEWEERERVFERNGTALVGRGFPLKSFRRCIRKDETYRWLDLQGLDAPAYRTPGSVDELREAALSLGYPARKVVLKPITGAGNRGLRILDASHDPCRAMIADKPDTAITSLESCASVLAEAPAFPALVAMEYLPGREYSVYCLCDRGRAVYVVPLERIKPAPGMSLTAQVDLQPDVIAYAERIAAAFGVHGNADFQMKRNAAGRPILYEINPRYSGTMVLPYAAGVDLPYFGILQALGREIPRVAVRNGVRMIRYADEIFVGGGEVFRLTVPDGRGPIRRR